MIEHDFRRNAYFNSRGIQSCVKDFLSNAQSEVRHHVNMRQDKWDIGPLFWLEATDNARIEIG